MQMDSLYSKVKEDLEKKIANGIYKPGNFIPTEQELEEYYRVSRTTIRKAVTMLVDDGYLTILRGVGTKVAPSKLKTRGSELMSFTELMKKQGVVPGVKDIRMRVIRAPEDAAAVLNLHPWDEVVEIYRLRTADGEPITTNISYIVYDLFKGRDLDALKHFQSLYRVLEDEYKIFILTAEDTYSAVNATARQAEALGINKNDPLLSIERIAYDQNARPVEWSRIALRGDRYKHIITLRRR